MATGCEAEAGTAEGRGGLEACASSVHPGRSRAQDEAGAVGWGSPPGFCPGFRGTGFDERETRLNEPVLMLGCCLERMAGIPVASVDLVLTDPPYYRVKAEAWDRQWSTPQAYLCWLDEVLEQFARVLKPNGSLYLFASPEMAARVECLVSERFNVLTRITWRKPAFATKAEMFRKEDLRQFFPASEVIIFAEQRVNGLSSLANAIQTTRKSAGLKSTEVDIALGYVRTNDATKGTELCRRWEEGTSIPSEQDFARVMEACGKSELRQQYEELRRPFTLSADAPYTDVWDFKTVGTYEGKHPCEKPLPLLLHILRASSRPGALVLDAFAGSAATGAACIRTGRQFVGIESDAHWFAYGRERLARADHDHRNSLDFGGEVVTEPIRKDRTRQRQEAMQL